MEEETDGVTLEDEDGKTVSLAHTNDLITGVVDTIIIVEFLI